ncbi:AMP-binding protein [Nocardioides jiangxiensis]|uniref:AMP-binding protein n=1 Tax=Nocardioides jiangxiensis TaxID=3064524 RepID=A0ABT9B184_9ACTN|nr:AMP-binding protein [Nocardioides sp. WY-20]MDO7868611.1 AMP-binding protein [Nocardioides sp. WY-20]
MSSSPAPLRLSGDAYADIDALRRWMDGTDEQRLLIETSGSSGTPKRVLLSREAMLASAEASAFTLRASGPWVLALPSSYVAGVNVIVRSLFAGYEPTVVDEHGLGWAITGAEARDHTAPVFLSLVPTQLARALDNGAERQALARSVHTVLLGGGPIDPVLRARAEEAGIRVVATYGASETSGGCVYDGYPLDGIELGLTDDDRIRIRGPVLFDGYLDDPALTAETLVDGWYLTSDLGTLAEDGRLSVLGRVDDMLISGGVKVPAPVVARRLCEHHAVAAAEVVGVEDPEWGQAVVAVVATPGLASMPAMTLLEARSWVAAAHPRTWAPRRLVVVEELPLLTNGKVDRQAVRALAEAAT